jgi:hypothetical protein
MNGFDLDRCGAEGKAVICDRCSEISDPKIRGADKPILRRISANGRFQT